MVYVPGRPYLSKNEKMILQNFGQLAFLKYIVSYFLKKKKKKKTLETYINNQNQESNYLYYNKLKIASFSSMQNIIFKKIPTLGIK